MLSTSRLDDSDPGDSRSPIDMTMNSSCEYVCTVIADDLTGACDASVQFANFGYSAVVVLDRASISSATAQVIGVSTDSRGDAPAEAACKVRQIADLIGQPGKGQIFKKVDSTLRGNIAAEINAAMMAFGCRAGVIAPAFPEMGRLLSGGWLVTPPPGAIAPIHLPTLLTEQGLTGLAHFDQAAIAGQPDRLRIRMNDGFARGVRFFVFDGVSDSDLEIAVTAASGLDPRILWAGSAGLARSLARFTAGNHRPPAPGPISLGSASEPEVPVVFAIGSDHPVTVEQLKALAANRPVEAVHADPEDLPAAITALRSRRTVIARLDPGTTGEASVRDFFAGLLNATVHGLVISGGDTASLVFSALGAAFIRLAGEVVTGIPWGRIGGGRADGICVATKSGGFGAPDALIQTADFLGVSMT
jgi:uncharacterized protein YgbK (DUF1537 family)